LPETQEQFSAWATRLGKSRFIARQLSRRGGELHCELRGEWVTIAGHAVKFMEGGIVGPD
jgi:predicted PhzF superfamily epimerase YddE/YHI9